MLLEKEYSEQREHFYPASCIIDRATSLSHGQNPGRKIYSPYSCHVLRSYNESAEDLYILGLPMHVQLLSLDEDAQQVLVNFYIWSAERLEKILGVEHYLSISEFCKNTSALSSYARRRPPREQSGFVWKYLK